MVDPLHLVFAGRASALFAVLAGVALALVSGRTTPPVGAALTSARRAVLGRAGVVLVIGLTLGVPQVRGRGDPRQLRAPVRRGAAVAGVPVAGDGVVGRRVAGRLPVVSHACAGSSTPGPGPVTSWLSLADPGELLVTVALTGYYPVLTWTGYLLVGLAVGRSPLLRQATQGWRAG